MPICIQHPPGPWQQRPRQHNALCTAGIARPTRAAMRAEGHAPASEQRWEHARHEPVPEVVDVAGHAPPPVHEEAAAPLRFNGPQPCIGRVRCRGTSANTHLPHVCAPPRSHQALHAARFLRPNTSMTKVDAARTRTDRGGGGAALGSCRKRSFCEFDPRKVT